jgi:hypothetical protein
MMGVRHTRFPILCALVASAAVVCGVAVAMGGSSLPAVEAPPSGRDDPAPDLVRVVATNGMTGYCHDQDTLGPCPDDAEANTKACLRGYKIPVYEPDGTTQIGEFVVGGPGSEAVYGQAGGTRVTMTAREDGTIVTTERDADGSVTSHTLEALDGTVTTLE